MEEYIKTEKGIEEYVDQKWKVNYGINWEDCVKERQRGGKIKKMDWGKKVEQSRNSDTSVR